MPEFPLKLTNKRIVIACFLKGPADIKPCKMLLDTSAALTTITFDKARELGIDPEASERFVSIDTRFDIHLRFAGEAVEFKRTS